MTKLREQQFGPKLLLKVFGVAFFGYLFRLHAAALSKHPGQHFQHHQRFR